MPGPAGQRLSCQARFCRQKYGNHTSHRRIMTILYFAFLLCHFRGTGFPNHGHFDLTGKLQTFFQCIDNIPADESR